MRFSRNKPIVMTSDVLFCSADDSKTQEVQFSIKNDKSIKSSHVRSWTGVCTAFIFPCLGKKKTLFFFLSNKQWHHSQINMVGTWRHGVDVVSHFASSLSRVDSQFSKNKIRMSKIRSIVRSATDRVARNQSYNTSSLSCAFVPQTFWRSGICICLHILCDGQNNFIKHFYIRLMSQKGALRACQRWHLGLQTACEVHFLHNLTELHLVWVTEEVKLAFPWTENYRRTGGQQLFVLLMCTF